MQPMIVMRPHDAVMRTTVDLPDDVHRAAQMLARDRHQSLSRTVAELLRRALAGESAEGVLAVDPGSGLPVVHLQRRIDADDVAAAEEG